MYHKPETPTKTRFVTYCIVSLTSVAIFQLGPPASAGALQIVLWYSIAPCTPWLLFFALEHYFNDWRCCVQGSITKCPHTLYTIQLALLLPLFGFVATYIKTHLAVPASDANLGTDVQACAIHFALSFLVVSECEFYRMYWVHRGRELPVPYSAFFTVIWEANQDREFEESRDCISYPLTVSRPEIPQNEAASWFSPTVFRTAADFVGFHIPAMWTFGAAIRLLLGVAEPDSFVLSVIQMLYTPRHPSFVVLDVLLQRPIRLLLRMISASAMGLGYGFWAWWRDAKIEQGQSRHEDASMGHLERCAAHRTLATS